MSAGVCFYDCGENLWQLEAAGGCKAVPAVYDVALVALGAGDYDWRDAPARQVHPLGIEGHVGIYIVLGGGVFGVALLVKINETFLVHEGP